MKHYCCIINSIEQQSNGTRFTILVVRKSSIQSSQELEWEPPIVRTGDFLNSNSKSIVSVSREAMVHSI